MDKPVLWQNVAIVKDLAAMYKRMTGYSTPSSWFCAIQICFLDQGAGPTHLDQSLSPLFQQQHLWWWGAGLTMQQGLLPKLPPPETMAPLHEPKSVIDPPHLTQINIFWLNVEGIHWCGFVPISSVSLVLICCCIDMLSLIIWATNVWWLFCNEWHTVKFLQDNVWMLLPVIFSWQWC